jgi:hypothetical protein
MIYPFHRIFEIHFMYLEISVALLFTLAAPVFVISRFVAVTSTSTGLAHISPFDTHNPSRCQSHMFLYPSLMYVCQVTRLQPISAYALNLTYNQSKYWICGGR